MNDTWIPNVVEWLAPPTPTTTSFPAPPAALGAHLRGLPQQRPPLVGVEFSQVAHGRQNLAARFVRLVRLREEPHEHEGGAGVRDASAAGCTRDSCYPCCPRGVGEAPLGGRRRDEQGCLVRIGFTMSRGSARGAGTRAASRCCRLLRGRRTPSRGSGGAGRRPRHRGGGRRPRSRRAGGAGRGRGARRLRHRGGGTQAGGGRWRPGGGRRRGRVRARWWRCRPGGGRRRRTRGRWGLGPPWWGRRRLPTSTLRRQWRVHPATADGALDRESAFRISSP